MEQKKQTNKFKTNSGNYAYIDSQNLNLGVQALGWKMDWRKLRKFLEVRYGVSKAFLFIGYIQENEAMYTQLYDAGFLIVLKPTVEVHKYEDKDKVVLAGAEPEPEKKSQIKGNIDTELVLYSLKDMNEYNKAVIVSGDGDFFSLIEYLISKDKLKAVLTPNHRYSSLLRQFESYVHPMDNLRNELSYRPSRKNKAS